MKNILLLTGAAMAAVATPALAQDESTGSGLYFGGLTGIDSVRISDGSDSGSDEDIMYGLTAGYDYVSDSGAVFGIETEYSDSGVSESADDVLVTGDSFRLAAARDLYVGVRGGIRLDSGALLYAKGGYTNARIKAVYDDGTDTISNSDTLDGFRLGAGAEFGFGPGFAARIEYRFSDYGDYSYARVNTGLSAQRHQGVVALLAKL